MIMAISGGTVHPMVADFKKALVAKPKAVAQWESLTPLARNEFICWIISPKTESVRDAHIKRTVEDLIKGKRRPCCWYGCVHRKDKKMNASQKWVLGRISKKAS